MELAALRDDLISVNLSCRENFAFKGLLLERIDAEENLVSDAGTWFVNPDLEKDYKVLSCGSVTHQLATPKDSPGEN